jgi:hypothetical protein
MKALPHVPLQDNPDVSLSGLGDPVHRSMAPPAEAGIRLSSSATINAQFWVGQSPIRPAAVWAVLAALLSAGIIVGPRAADWRMVVLLLLLADPLWGNLWRMAAGRAELLQLHERVVSYRFWWPYLEPGSPASALADRDSDSALPLILRVAIPSLLLTLLVATALSVHAIWLTGGVLIVSVFGYISIRSFHATPLLLQSVVAITLPWVLTLLQMGEGPAGEHWQSYMALAGLWTVHNWGEGRLLRNANDRFGAGLVVAADLGVALLMVKIRALLWLAILAVLWLPTWSAIISQQPARRLNVWWLAALLASAAALGQSL